MTKYRIPRAVARRLGGLETDWRGVSPAVDAYTLNVNKVGGMVCCELDDAVAGEALGQPLAAWQALLLHRVLPSCGGLVVYLTLVCFDIALIVEHYKNGDQYVGAFCVMLMVLPALASLVFTLASPPPGLRADAAAALSVSLGRGDLAWLLQQIVNFCAFPLAAICRYCHQIFWSVEAVCGAYVGDTERAREALLRVRAPSPLELYLFLQAFLHAAPHALLNVLDMLAYREQPSFDKISVQSVSIVVSMMRMASTATIYRRFEREKLCGRRYPWALDTENLLDDNKVDESIALNESNEATNPAIAVVSNISQEVTRNTMINNLNNELNKTMDKSYSFIDNLAHRSSFSSSGSEEYLAPIKPNEILHRADSYEEANRRKSIIQRVAPKRDSTIYNIVHVDVPPPPTAMAPRPKSLAAWAEMIVENAESLPEKMSAPQRRRHAIEEIPAPVVASASQQDVPLPVATPRSYMRGLEPQDASAAIVHYLAWYLFFVARLLSIAVFLQFHPVVGIVLLACHYQLMLLLLIVPQASTVRRTFYVFLAFVYVFCLLEFKVRFRHVRAWHVFWLVLMTAETVVFAGLWRSLGGGGVDWWWQSYVISVVFGSILMSYMCMLVYFVLLKPKETVVYLNEKN